MDSSAGIMGPLLIAFALALLGLSIAVHFFYLLPYNSEQLVTTRGYDPQSWSSYLIMTAHYIFSIWLIVLIMFNYYQTITTQPGSPPLAPTESIQPPPPQQQHSVSITVDYDSAEGSERSGRTAATSGNTATIIKVCDKCRRVKPERTHHCSICGRCILRMDHHCPWMNNCVGHFNHRYFYLFMLYLWAACVYCLLMGYRPTMDLIYDPKLPIYPSGSVDMIKYHTQKMLLLVMMLALALSFTLGGMLLWHTYMICHNQTTLEFLARRSGGRFYMDGIGFDIGLRGNLRQFFNLHGRRRWWSILLPVTVPPFGDGTRFPSMNSAESMALVDRLAADANDDKYI